VPAKQGSELASPGPAPPSLKSVEPASALERQRVDNVKAPEPDFDRQAEAAARAEAERLAELKVINDKTEQDRARERERTAALQAEADKLAKERELLSAQAELDRQARERAAADARAQAETRAQAERAAQERAARERAAANAEATAQFGASVAGKWTYRSEGGGSGDTRQITEEELTIRPDCTGSLRRTFITQSKTFAGWSNSGKDTMELAFRCSGAGVVTGQVTGQFALQGTALSFNGNSYRRR
jgi:colicin import membrane protein